MISLQILNTRLPKTVPPNATTLKREMLKCGTGGRQGYNFNNAHALQSSKVEALLRGSTACFRNRKGTAPQWLSGVTLRVSHTKESPFSGDNI